MADVGTTRLTANVIISDALRAATHSQRSPSPWLSRYRVADAITSNTNAALISGSSGIEGLPFWRRSAATRFIRLLLSCPQNTRMIVAVCTAPSLRRRVGEDISQSDDVWSEDHAALRIHAAPSSAQQPRSAQQSRRAQESRRIALTAFSQAKT
ncbi:hypothetical protein FHX76_002270 [Lysinibacter cavernae]|uniref:Uncharacterized protein n=1 Tax=Lysinibacter cavernae TaxID=1640652 RepID=A0A7X5R2B4_9MICO|nr:hypothetical protein [Lysinibacter cavernae]